PRASTTTPPPTSRRAGVDVELIISTASAIWSMRRLRDILHGRGRGGRVYCAGHRPGKKGALERELGWLVTGRLGLLGPVGRIPSVPGVPWLSLDIALLAQRCRVPFPDRLDFLLDELVHLFRGPTHVAHRVEFLRHVDPGEHRVGLQAGNQLPARHCAG